MNIKYKDQGNEQLFIDTSVGAAFYFHKDSAPYLKLTESTAINLDTNLVEMFLPTDNILFVPSTLTLDFKSPY